MISMERNEVMASGLVQAARAISERTGVALGDVLLVLQDIDVFTVDVARGRERR